MGVRRLGLLRGVPEGSILENEWWEFHGGADELRIDGFEDAADDFQPALNSGDFSVAGVIAPADVVAAYSTPFGKWAGTSGNKLWRITQYEDDLHWQHSLNGVGSSVVSVTGELAVDTKAFIAGVYEYSGSSGTTSFAKVWVNGVSNSISNAHGPIRTSDVTRVTIGTDHSDADFEGKEYWLAYWNKKLSDAEVSDLYTKTKMPWDISNLFMCITFGGAVGATYETEYGLGPNAPYTFDVYGTPTAGP